MNKKKTMEADWSKYDELKFGRFFEWHEFNDECRQFVPEPLIEFLYELLIS